MGEELQVQVMEIYKTVIGVDRLRTLTSVKILALTYWHQGR